MSPTPPVTDTARAVHRTLVQSAAAPFLTVYGDADVVTVVYPMADYEDFHEHRERLGEFLGVYEHVIEAGDAPAPARLRGVIPLADDRHAAETLAWVMRREWVDAYRAGELSPDGVVDRIAEATPWAG
jgi:hypothetical protein